MFGALVTLWLLAWTILVLSIDVHFMIQFGRAVRAASFPSVVGQITQSAIKQTLTADLPGERRELHLAIAYRYQPYEDTLEGHRLSFWSQTWPGGRRQMEQRLEQFLIGEQVDVYFDPNDAANSALDRRLGGGPLFVGLLLMPFNLVMVGGWVWLRRRARGLLGRLIHADGRRWVVRRAFGDPILTGVIVAEVLSLGAILLASLAQWQENVTGLLLLWGALLLVSVAAIWHARRTRYFEPARLICDGGTGKVTWFGDNSENSGQSHSVSQWRRTKLDDDVPLDTWPEPLSGYAVRLIFGTLAGGEETRTVLVTENALEAATLSEWLDDWFRSRVPESESRGG